MDNLREISEKLSEVIKVIESVCEMCTIFCKAVELASSKVLTEVFKKKKSYSKKNFGKKSTVFIIYNIRL